MSDFVKKHKWLIIGLVAVVAILLAVFLFQKLDRAREKARLSTLDNSLPSPWTVELNGRRYTLRPGIETCLVMGLDNFSDSYAELDPEARTNDIQADFLFLMIIDRQKETFTALHIDRDTMTEVPQLNEVGLTYSYVTEQLALSHAYGTGGKDSCLNTVHTVSRLLYDLPIDHYVAVTMDGVPVIANSVGGVPVYVEDDFSAVTPELPQGETVLLTDDLALLFVRYRYGIGEGTNVERMGRQRTFLYSLEQVLKTRLSEDKLFAVRFADQLSPYVLSDIIPEEYASMIESGMNYSFSGIETIKGKIFLSEDLQFMEFYPDEAQLKKQLVRLLLQPA